MFHFTTCLNRPIIIIYRFKPTILNPLVTTSLNDDKKNKTKQILLEQVSSEHEIFHSQGSSSMTHKVFSAKRERQMFVIFNVKMSFGAQTYVSLTGARWRTPRRGTLAPFKISRALYRFIAYPLKSYSLS